MTPSPRPTSLTRNQTSYISLPDFLPAVLELSKLSSQKQLLQPLNYISLYMVNNCFNGFTSKKISKKNYGLRLIILSQLTCLLLNIIGAAILSSQHTFDRLL